MTSSARIVEPVPLHGCGIVGVAGTRHIFQCIIVPRTGIHIPEQDGNRSSRGASFEDSAEDFRLVALNPRSGPLGSTLAPENVGFQGGCIKLYARFDAIHDHPQSGPVGFPEYADFEYPAERIHTRPF